MPPTSVGRTDDGRPGETLPSDLDGLLGRMTGVGLAELEERASLQTRTDRKYVLPASLVPELLSTMGPSVAALRIGSATRFRYDTVYFDTSGLDAYLGTARRRRDRFKVRIRTYAGSGISMLEVKGKGARGVTVKQRAPHPASAGATLTEEARAFVDGVLGQPGLAARLRPVLVTSFERTTLLDRRAASRATLDLGVELRTTDGGSIPLPGLVVFETKSSGAATDADRWLWARGHRPTPFSKYCVGMALHDPGLPANRWNRVLRRDLGWVPHLTGPRSDTVSPPGPFSYNSHHVHRELSASWARVAG